MASSTDMGCKFRSDSSTVSLGVWGFGGWHLGGADLLSEKFEKKILPNGGDFNFDEPHEIESVKKSPTRKIQAYYIRDIIQHDPLIIPIVGQSFCCKKGGVDG